MTFHSYSLNFYINITYKGKIIHLYQLHNSKLSSIFKKSQLYKNEILATCFYNHHIQNVKKCTKFIFSILRVF